MASSTTPRPEASALSKWVDEDAPVWAVNVGVDGVLVNLTQDFSRAEQYNAVGIEFTPDREYRRRLDEIHLRRGTTTRPRPPSTTGHSASATFSFRGIRPPPLRRRSRSPRPAQARRIHRRHPRARHHHHLQPAAPTRRPHRGGLPRHRRAQRITSSKPSPSTWASRRTMDIETRLQRDPGRLRRSPKNPPETVPLIMPELIPPEERTVSVQPPTGSDVLV